MPVRRTHLGLAARRRCGVELAQFVVALLHLPLLLQLGRHPREEATARFWLEEPKRRHALSVLNLNLRFKKNLSRDAAKGRGTLRVS